MLFHRVRKADKSVVPKVTLKFLLLEVATMFVEVAC